MSWKTFAVLSMISIIIAQIVMKKASDRAENKAIGIFYQYLAAALLAWLFWFLLGPQKLELGFLLVALTGLVNSAGNYYQWRAYGLSLSKTSLFFPLIGIIVVIPAVIFLGASYVWNAQMFTGLLFYFAAILVFFREQIKSTDTGGSNWLFYTLAMVVILTITNFALKLFALNLIFVTNFVIFWYTGSLAGSLFLLWKERQHPIKVSRQNLAWFSAVGVGLIVTISLGYQSLGLGAPLSQLGPLHGMASSVIPSAVGLVLFQEAKKFSLRDWLGFALGLVAAILILLR